MLCGFVLDLETPQQQRKMEIVKERWTYVRLVFIVDLGVRCMIIYQGISPPDLYRQDPNIVQIHYLLWHKSSAHRL